MSRQENSLKNTLIGTICHITTLLIGFVTRTIFIHFLGKDYLGINGLFTNVLSLLSFAELGIGTAIVYALYKPLADNDERQICSLMNFYKKAYVFIGFFIAAVGLGLVPFLDVFIKDKPAVSNLDVLYILVLTNTVISYFFTYKRSLIIASQNSFVNSINTTIFTLLQNVFQIFVLILTRNYIYYLFVQICSTLLSNISISIKANKMFPYLRKYKKERIEKATVKSIGKNVVAMMSSKIGSVIVSGTGNLFISAFVGVGAVALYSNYVLIYNMLNGVINQVFNAITASVGNLTAKESSERSNEVFNKVFFVNFVIMCFSSTCLFVLFNPFIEFWIGNEYLLPMSIVSLIVLNFFIYGIRHTSITYINAYGLFWQIKYKSLVEAAINIAVSLILLIKFDMGMYGVLLATTISTVLTNVWWEPYVVYKYRFNKSVMLYMGTMSAYLAVAVICCVLGSYIMAMVKFEGFVLLLTGLAICVFITFAVISIVFGKSNNYKFCIKIFVDVIKKLKR